ncbi:hypothetical protein LXA43DRAFT_674291 [Ganoderma leucocontextum]|nr:hypothetical protein LXA43DRAFT_674291 [Ganoderma leucocontextum]
MRTLRGAALGIRPPHPLLLIFTGGKRSHCVAGNAAAENVPTGGSGRLVNGETGKWRAGYDTGIIRLSIPLCAVLTVISNRTKKSLTIDPDHSFSFGGTRQNELTEVCGWQTVRSELHPRTAGIASASEYTSPAQGRERDVTKRNTHSGWGLVFQERPRSTTADHCQAPTRRTGRGGASVGASGFCGLSPQLWIRFKPLQGALTTHLPYSILAGCWAGIMVGRLKPMSMGSVSTDPVLEPGRLLRCSGGNTGTWNTA